MQQLARLHAAPVLLQHALALISLQLLAQQDELVVLDVVVLPLAVLELNVQLLLVLPQCVLALNVQLLPFLQQCALALNVQLLPFLPQCALALNVQPLLVQQQCVLALDVLPLPFLQQCVLVLNVQLLPFRLQFAVVLLFASGYQPLLLLALLVAYLICQNQTKTGIYFFLPYLLITTYKNLINLHE